MSTGTTDVRKSKMKELPISQIRENNEALRKVNKKDPKYPELVDSIRTHGVLNPISVRETRGPEGELFYGLIDGLHRYTGAIDAGLSTIPCHILSMSAGDVLTAQIVANVQKIETKPVEYSKQLERILFQNPMWTMTDLASRVNKSPEWLRQRLKLVTLPNEIGALVDDNKIVLSNAYALVDLHNAAPDEIPNFLDRAQTMPPVEFASNVSVRVKEIKKARAQGREAKPDEFTPAPFLQKTKAFKDEYENPQIGAAVCSAMNATTAEKGFRAAIYWALHMDPLSIQEGKEKFEAEKKAQIEEREKRKAAREAEKAKKATENTVNATEKPNPDAFVNKMAE